MSCSKTPDQDQQITRNTNTQQLGEGANKIQLDGGTGNVSVPGSLTVTGAARVGGLTTTNDVVITTGANSYGRVMSTDQYHAMILRGDINYNATNYTVNGGQAVTKFVQFGCTYSFRQVTTLATSLVFEITPTHVNIPTSLRAGGYTAGMRPFVSCAVPGGTGGVAAHPETCGDIHVRRGDLEPTAVSAALCLLESPDPIPPDPRGADCRMYRVGFAIFSIAAKDDGMRWVSADHSTVIVSKTICGVRPDHDVVGRRQPAHRCGTGHGQGAGDADVARAAVQLDLVRSPALLLCPGVPRDRLILVGRGEHDVARRPVHDPLTGVREDLRHQHICW